MKKPVSIRENYLRTANLEFSEWIPCSVFWPNATWLKYGTELEELMSRHPIIFGPYDPGTLDLSKLRIRRSGTSYTDEWGCTWFYAQDGIQGQVQKHPLGKWESYKDFNAPNFEHIHGPPLEGEPPGTDWKSIEAEIKIRRTEEEIIWGYSPHGILFQRLYYLRGMANLLMDFMREPPQLQELIEDVVNFNLKLIRKWMDIGVDVMWFGDDLGTQDRLTMNPRVFRKYLLPAYKTMFKEVRRSGTKVYLHSDGYWLEIANDILDSGVNIINPQSRASTLNPHIQNISDLLKGRVCIDLDLDRQFILPHGSPQEIRDHVNFIIKTLGSEKGGLMLKADIYPEVPLSSIEVLCQTLEAHDCAGSGGIPIKKQNP